MAVWTQTVVLVLHMSRKWTMLRKLDNLWCWGRLVPNEFWVSWILLCYWMLGYNCGFRANKVSQFLLIHSNVSFCGVHQQSRELWQMCPEKQGLNTLTIFWLRYVNSKRVLLFFFSVSEVPELYFWDINAQFRATWILHLVYHLVF